MITDSLRECNAKRTTWKDGMEDRGLTFNVNKTKLMISGPGHDLLCDSGLFLCAVCQTGVWVNSFGVTGSGYLRNAVLSGANLLRTQTMRALDVMIRQP